MVDHIIDSISGGYKKIKESLCLELQRGQVVNRKKKEIKGINKGIRGFCYKNKQNKN